MSSLLKRNLIITLAIFGTFLIGCTNDPVLETPIEQESKEEDNEEETDETDETEETDETNDFLGLIWNQQGDRIDDLTIPFFGGSMDMNSAGSRIIIGTPDSPSACSTYCDGVVRVYDLNNGTWTQVNNDLYGTSNSQTDWIGDDVAINSDGNFIVASYKPFANTIGYYTTRVFQDQNGDWAQVGQDIINSAGLGSSVAINAAGNVLAVAMPKNNRDYLTKIYRLNNDEWVQIGEDIVPGKYSVKVALNASGTLLTIGNSFEEGYVQFFSISENDWQLYDKIEGDSDNYRLSFASDLSSEGNTLVLEGVLDSSCNNCFAEPYFKVYEGNGATWEQKGQKITFPAVEGFVINRQRAVAINQDGSRIAVGLKRIATGDISTLGKLYIHTYQFSETDQEWKLIPSIIEISSRAALFELEMNDEGNIVAAGLNQSGRKSVEVFKLEPTD